MTTKSYRALVSAPEASRPLVFAFHGTGGDEHQFFDLAGQLVPGAGVVSPRGDVFEMGAARFFRRMGEGVYDMDDLARATAKMTAIIEAGRPVAPAGHVGTDIASCRDGPQSPDHCGSPRPDYPVANE